MADDAVHYYVNPNYHFGDPHDSARSQAPPPLRDEHPVVADRRSSRRASPPLSEAYSAPSSVQGDQIATGINTVSPELLAQLTERITKEVVEHLKQTGTIDATPELPRAEPMHRSSTNGTSTPSPPLSARKVYTPPSPKPEPRKATVESPPHSPVRVTHRPRLAMLDSASGDVPRSPVRETRRARVESFSDSSPQSPIRETQQTSPKEKEKPRVQFVNHTPADKDPRSSRPSAAYRTYSNLELSTIDQKWGMLFDREQNPTPRLGQFLRGLANHIIEEFQPQRSIVVTPMKMAAYYANHSLDREVYPLLTIFKSNSHENISKLYRDLGCQHHLVQEELHKAPNVPGLTPAGFAQWLTTWILAYPEQEATRLEKIVLAMPIDADGAIVDGKPERLPKQISRHLLPSKELTDVKASLSNAVEEFMDELGMPKRKASLNNSPTLTRRESGSQSRRPVEVHQTTRPVDIPQTKPNPGRERERMPYSGGPDSLDSESSVQIERERQPYTAQPGNGKVYNNLGVPSKGRERANSASRMTKEPEGNIHHERRVRTQSNAIPYVPSSRPAGARRQPSPPIQKFSQSTPLNINGGASYIPPSMSPSNSSFNKPSTAYTPASYIPSSYPSSANIPPPPPFNSRDGDRDRERDRDLRGRERDSRDRHEEPREPRRRESRRSTVDESPRPPIDITSPRDAEKWDRINEGRMFEDASPIDTRHESRRENVVLDEDYYRSNGRTGVGYENGQFSSR